MLGMCQPGILDIWSLQNVLNKSTTIEGNDQQCTAKAYPQNDLRGEGQGIGRMEVVDWTIPVP
jgi:hypothetical protein